MTKSNRIKTLRLAKGLSLEALAREMGGVVTKQALSKYEQSKAQPKPSVAIQLAAVLGVKTIELFTDPSYEVNFVAYRKGSGLGEKQQEEIQSIIEVQMQKRFQLQKKMGILLQQSYNLSQYSINQLEDAEVVANELRHNWDLGLDAISNIAETLESRNVHVLILDISDKLDKFDGISAFINNGEGEICGAVVVSRRGIPGERQRLTLAHELGHLVLKVPENIDEEKAAYRFAGAFLLPASLMYRELGKVRTHISFQELLLLKQRFGISVQALIMRANQLGIISDAYKTSLFKQLNYRGWRNNEPSCLPEEITQRWSQIIMRAVAEGFISTESAEEWLGSSVSNSSEYKEHSIDRRAFLKLPVAQRNILLAQQATVVEEEFLPGAEGMEWADEYVEDGILDD